MKSLLERVYNKKRSLEHNSPTCDLDLILITNEVTIKTMLGILGHGVKDWKGLNSLYGMEVIITRENPFRLYYKIMERINGK